MKRAENAQQTSSFKLGGVLSIDGLNILVLSFLNTVELARYSCLSRSARRTVFNLQRQEISDNQQIKTIQTAVRKQCSHLLIRPTAGPVLWQGARRPCAAEVIQHTLDRLYKPSTGVVADIIIAGVNEADPQLLIAGDSINAAHVRRYLCCHDISRALAFLMISSGFILTILPLHARSLSPSYSTSTLAAVIVGGIALMLMSYCFDGDVNPSYVHKLMARCALWSQPRVQERVPFQNII